MNSYLLIDLNFPPTRALTRMRSIFSVRNGIFSPIERLQLTDSKAQIYFLHPDKRYEQYIAEIEGILSYQSNCNMESDKVQNWLVNSQKREKKISKFQSQYKGILLATKDTFFAILDQLSVQILADIPIWNSLNPTQGMWQSKGYSVMGSRKDLYLHKSAFISPGVVLDTRSGPIVLDDGVNVSPFSYLSGPLYVAPHSHLDNVRITGGVILGKAVRVGGEIESSIIGNFSNKHHEGFIGHSMIGNWVNLGALTTTSDLKNNYGNIRLPLAVNSIVEGEGQTKKANQEEQSYVDTKRIKFGAIIGDHVKTAIGSLLTSGTIIDACSNVFGGNVPKYLAPFSWGTNGKYYQLARFLQDSQKIAARRKQSLGPVFAKLAEYCYSTRG